jgi:hypothetical protein
MVLINGSGSFLPSSSSLLPTSRPYRMSNTPRTGIELLAETKVVLARAQANRTAEAVVRYLTSSETDNDNDIYDTEQEVSQGSSAVNEEVSQGSSAVNGEVWERHDSAISSDIIFTRSGGETLSISKSPGGDRWLILYDEPTDLPA